MTGFVHNVLGGLKHFFIKNVKPVFASTIADLEVELKKNAAPIIKAGIAAAEAAIRAGTFGKGLADAVYHAILPLIKAATPHIAETAIASFAAAIAHEVSE